MPLSNSNDWPIWHEDAWRAANLAAGALPLSHDIALARYLEKQSAYRESARRPFDLGATMTKLCAFAAGIRRVLADVGVLLRSSQPGR
jgi:hypothetical protein